MASKPRMTGEDPDTFFRHFLDTWVADPASIPAEVRAAYLAGAGTPEAVHTICQDYGASALIDGDHDEQDQRQGRQLSMPVLAMWHDPRDTPLPFDPRQVWSRCAPDLRTQSLSCGHFLPEERPDEVTTAITDLIHAKSQT